MRQQASASLGHRQQSVGVGALRHVSQEVDRGVGDLCRSGADGRGERHDPIGFVTDRQEPDDQLDQRGAGHAPAAATAVLDHTGVDELVESVGHELGEQTAQLIEVGRRPRLIDVDQLVRSEAKDLAQLATVAPGRQQVADPGQRVAPSLQSADELEATQVGGPVHADTTTALGRRQHAEGLVLADGADGHVGLPGQGVHAHLIRLDHSHASTLPVFTVTVNTVTIGRSDIEAALRTEWPEATLAAEPTPVTGGEWATMLRLTVRGVPEGVPEDLVLRLAPHPEMAAKEIAVQRVAAAAGVATPAIRMTGRAGGCLGEAWAVMDFASGAPLLASLDGLAALPRLPGIARRLPVELAAAMATIHLVDPEPVSVAVREVAPGTSLSVDELLPHLRVGAEASNRPDLVESLDRLVDVRPAERSLVLCHGDVHPLNVLVDGDVVTVLDWTGAVVAPPSYDVAWTWLLLRFPPLAVPSAVRPVVDRAGQMLAGRFLRSYRSQAPTSDLSDLDWHRALHGCRVLIDLALWEATGDPRAKTHPARLSAPGASQLVAKVTGPTLAR